MCLCVYAAMANLAHHVMAHEYSEEGHDNTSSVETGRTHSTISEDTRDDSPLSSSSGQDHVETGGVSVMSMGVWG